MDSFITLANRLLSRAPAVGFALSQQLINDAWRTLQSRREWSWRRRHSNIAPPNLYQTGTASTNVGTGNPYLVTGTGTTWTPDMVGRQIRIGGLLNPYYTIVAWNSATEIVLDKPWVGPEAVLQTYQIIKIYYAMPEDFGYFYCIWSTKDAFQLWTNVTEADLAVLDPQRTNQGQTYACVMYDYTANYSGVVGSAVQVLGSGPGPVATTTNGYSYPTNATYIVTVTTGGITGVAEFEYKRVGQAYSAAQITQDLPQDLQDGVQVYWPTGETYVVGDSWMIQCQALVSSGVPRFEMWPGPTSSSYLYPFIYIAKEYDLTVEQPQLPPFVANRGEVLLEMALAACARYPGTDNDNPNPYFSLALAKMHDQRALELIQDLERNDEEVGVTNIDYKVYPYAPAPWGTGAWQSRHAPFLNG